MKHQAIYNTHPSVVGIYGEDAEVAVDSNGTQNESVVQDIVFAGASGNVSLTASRSMMIFQSNGSGWEWQSTTAY